MLTASNTSKTAKIIKGDVLLSSALTYFRQCAGSIVSPFMIFAVFHVLLAVNVCINYSSFYTFIAYYMYTV